MVSSKQITISDYERKGLELLKQKRKVSHSELIREAIRILMKMEGVEISEN